MTVGHDCFLSVPNLSMMDAGAHNPTAAAGAAAAM